jgi:hypothetical protein
LDFDRSAAILVSWVCISKTFIERAKIGAYLFYCISCTIEGSPYGCRVHILVTILVQDITQLIEIKIRVLVKKREEELVGNSGKLERSLISEYFTHLLIHIT